MNTDKNHEENSSFFFDHDDLLGQRVKNSGRSAFSKCLQKAEPNKTSDASRDDLL